MIERKKNKKELKSAFDNIFKNEKQEKQKDDQLANEQWISMNDKKFKEITNKKEYHRRLTIPLSRLQEKFLEDFIHDIHQNRNQKSQRLTKASLIRAMINSHYAMNKTFDKVEINDEDNLNERFFLYYKKK